MIRRFRSLCCIVAAVLVTIPACWADAQQQDLKPLIAKLRAVGPQGAGHREAKAAWQKLVSADPADLPQILAGMDDCGPLAENWLRAVVEAIAERHVQAGGKLPVAGLEKFLGETNHAPRGRRLAYELVAHVDPTAEERLIPGLIHDPSLELRRDAVALALKAAESTGSANDKPATIAAYRRAFQAARDVDQIKAASEKLRGLGETVDLPSHLGFVLKWKVAAPFDNSGTKGFDTVYPPETGVDLQAGYEGKGDRIGWIDMSTADDFGNLDLNQNLDTYEVQADAAPKADKPPTKKIRPQFKGAVAYAFAEFVSDQERDADIRLGSTNANKIWLNGKLLTSNHIYHTGREVDQYVGRGRLQKGKNQILLKIAQNEQSEEWAQDWQFQLRVCDKIGTAILSQDRAEGKTATTNEGPNGK